MKDARHGERELRDRRFESRAVLGQHLVAAAHRAHRRRDGCAARVLKAFAGLQQRLRAHHAEPAHFLHKAFGIGNDPVPADQLRRNAAQVPDRDGVGEDVPSRAFVGLLGEVLRRSVYLDFVRLGLPPLLLGQSRIVNSAGS